jgi:hypothetical protein
VVQRIGASLGRARTGQSIAPARRSIFSTSCRWRSRAIISRANPERDVAVGDQREQLGDTEPSASCSVLLQDVVDRVAVRLEQRPI